MKHCKVAIGVIGLGLLAATGAAGAPAARRARIGGHFEALASTAEARGEAAAVEQARGLGLKLRVRGGQTLIPVILEPAPGLTPNDLNDVSITNLGGLLDARSRHYVRALVPAGALRALSRDPNYSVTRTPAVPFENGGLGPLRSEAPALTGADLFHTAGLTGVGVDVAVIDLGFIGLAARIAEGELRNDTVSIDYSGTGIESGTSHGVGVAEHVADMAPGARIHCIKVSDEVDLQNAADYLAANNIPIANHSVGWVIASYYDDTGPISGIVNESHDVDGTFWAVSSGNSQRRHWRGGWTDADADGWLEFAAGDEQMNVATSSTTATFFLNWNQYGASVTNLDFFVYNKSNVVVAKSEAAQTGAQDPSEALSFTYQSASAPYTIRVKRLAGPTAGLDMTIFGFYNDVEYFTAASSCTDPANAHGAFAVGAINQVNWNLALPGVESFSSQGPTNDGRLKPQIAGPDGTTSKTYGNVGSYGTSFSSPTTAGAAALILAQDGSRTAIDLENLLSAWAIDVGAVGPDTVYGAGLLNLELPTCMDDADCQDASMCNGFEACVDGLCVNGAPPSCADGLACTTDTCNAATNACEHAANHGACDDGDACSADFCDVALGCQASPVVNGTVCNDGDVCTTADVCTDGACGGGDLNCDDGLFCNGVESCSRASGCVAGTPPCSSDGVACTTDACNEATNTCDHTPNHGACNDGNDCSTDACDLTLDCQTSPAANGTACDDGNACTTVDACTNGACGGSGALNCDDGAFCNGAESCNPASGCVAGAAACPSDGVVCTTDCNEANDLCYQPSDAACNDNNACTSDLCHPVSGCVVTQLCAAALASETFESNNWTGGVGWRAGWTAAGDSGIINTNTPHGGTRHLRLRRNTGVLTRALNMTGVISPRLQFWWKATSFEGAEKAVVQVSPDGTTWTTVHTITAAQANNVYTLADVSLAAFAPYSSNFRIRLKAQMGDTSDLLYYDDLQVTGLR
ncbi:MAG: hypothetical protein EXR76_07485 [Myxococcales bacterium]|nr:hypothetical protein [Myxococcales bacterium]